MMRIRVGSAETVFCADAFPTQQIIAGNVRHNNLKTKVLRLMRFGFKISKSINNRRGFLRVAPIRVRAAHRWEQLHAICVCPS